MNTKKYLVGAAALKNWLNSIYKKHISKDSDLIAIFEFTQNKHENDFYDVRVKNLYSRKNDSLERIDEKIKSSMYKCIKLKEPKEFTVIKFSSNSFSIDEELTSSIIVKEISGKYGSKYLEPAR